MKEQNEQCNCRSCRIERGEEVEDLMDHDEFERRAKLLADRVSALGEYVKKEFPESTFYFTGIVRCPVTNKRGDTDYVTAEVGDEQIRITGALEAIGFLDMKRQELVDAISRYRSRRRGGLDIGSILAVDMSDLLDKMGGGKNAS